MSSRLITYIFGFLLLPYGLFAAPSQQDIKARMQSDLEFYRSTFKTQYAPIEWKESYAGWNLDQEIDAAKASVLATEDITVKKYQRIVKHFFDTTQDQHVSVTFFSTEEAMLPLQVKSIDGHYYITAVDRSRLPTKMFPFTSGDEIIYFNGRPIAEVVKEFADRDFNQGKTATDRAFAEFFFTMRLGSLGHEVPQGAVQLTIKQQGYKTAKSYTVNWDYIPEKIKNIILSAPMPAKGLIQSKISLGSTSQNSGVTFPLNTSPLLKKLMLCPYSEVLSQAGTQLFGDHLGSKKSFIPALGSKIWEWQSNTQFHAYIFSNAEGRKVGYIRIPHYSGSQEHVEEFKMLINKFELETEALVIDQVNNPGGSLFYMYALASLLADKPLLIPPHRISLTQKEIAMALDSIPALQSVRSDHEAMSIIGDSLDGLPVTIKTAEGFLQYFQFMMDEWSKGNTFTEPTYIWGMKYIAPHAETHYTKPILVLINQLDISCGDFFPAIMQDNKRATLFGKKTAGAGGFVLAAEYPNLFGIKMFNYTGSIAQRIDKNPIENLGITPDIPYEITVDDYKHQYRSYVNAVNEALKVILKN